MGLDTVELVMAIEDSFGIVIEDRDAEQLSILGNMHRVIVEKIRERGEMVDEQAAWEKLKALVIYHLGVSPEEVVPEADIVIDLGAG